MVLPTLGSDLLYEISRQVRVIHLEISLRRFAYQG